jgi:hypothetical protein
MQKKSHTILAWIDVLMNKDHEWAVLVRQENKV